MANIKSQIKRNRQNEAARERNKSVRSALKTAVRRFHEAVEAGKTDEAKTLAADAAQEARQGRLQGRHPQEPGREPQVRDRQEGRRALIFTLNAPHLIAGRFRVPYDVRARGDGDVDAPCARPRRPGRRRRP